MSQALAEIDYDLEEIKLDLMKAVENLVTEDDEPVDNLYSEKQQRLLTEPLYTSWMPPQTDKKQNKPRKFLAAANVGVFPSIHQPPLVPDMFLSLDVTVPENWYEKSGRSYFCWEFGKAPEVVVEIVSNKKGGELSSKLRHYARIGVIYYIVYDPTTQLANETLHVYESHRGKFRKRKEYFFPDIGLGVRLWNGSFEGKKGTWLRWCDVHEKVIPTGAESVKRETKRATREAERAKHEAERAKYEAERASRLAEKLRELGVDPDSV